MNALARYSQTQKETASRERLLAPLSQATLRNDHAAAVLEMGRPIDARQPLARASAGIVLELAAIRPCEAPEPCERLAASCELVRSRLTKATPTRRYAPVREADCAAAPLAEAFVKAMARPGRSPAESLS
ncbi:flagellar export chaperone FliS [Myxococcus sp. Y35]|uniref:flagellar export chaperone FliS n=1 Tax=Pseudomyxococcus flavus TaxID=3115648 RepID=UPI003CEBBE44